MTTPDLITFDMLPAALSIVGAVLVARYDRFSKYGWACWAAANVLWIGWALADAADKPVWGVFAQNAFFLITSVQGFLKSRERIAASHVTAAVTP